MFPNNSNIVMITWCISIDSIQISLDATVKDKLKYLNENETKTMTMTTINVLQFYLLIEPPAASI